MPTLSSRLKHLRLSSTKPVQTIADFCGVSRQAVYKWENGQSIPDIANLVKLVDIFDTSVEYIVLGTADANISHPALITEDLKLNLENTKSFSGIKRCVSTFLKKCGLDKFFYMQKFRGDISKQPYVTTVTDLSSDWIKQYTIEEYASIDPAWNYSLSNVSPIYSNELFEQYAQKSCKATSEFILNLDQHVPYFVVIPIHGGCCLGTFVVSTSENSSAARKKLAHHIDSLTLIGHYVYSAVHRIQEIKKNHPDSTLTAKEIATIALLADGKSIDNIADQLHVTKAAVNARVERAKIKLNARNREQLVLFAASRNLLPHNIGGMQTKAPNNPNTPHKH